MSGGYRNGTTWGKNQTATYSIPNCEYRKEHNRTINQKDLQLTARVDWSPAVHWTVIIMKSSPVFNETERELTVIRLCMLCMEIWLCQWEGARLCLLHVALVCEDRDPNWSLSDSLRERERERERAGDWDPIVQMRGKRMMGELVAHIMCRLLLIEEDGTDQVVQLYKLKNTEWPADCCCSKRMERINSRIQNMVRQNTVASLWSEIIVGIFNCYPHTLVLVTLNSSVNSITKYCCIITLWHYDTVPLWYCWTTALRHCGTVELRHCCNYSVVW